MGATTSAVQHNATCCNRMDKHCASSHRFGGFSSSIPLYLDCRANAIQIQMQESNNGTSQKQYYKHPSDISCRQLAKTSQKAQSKFILTIQILINKSHENYVAWLITNQWWLLTYLATTVIAQSVWWLHCGLDSAWCNSWKQAEIFLFSRTPIPVLVPTQCPTQWVPKQLSARMTTHLHLVPTLRMSAAMPSHPYMPSRRAAGIYFYHTYKPMTSRKDGYLFVVEYFMQYHIIISPDKIFRHKSTEPLFIMATSNLQNPLLAKCTHFHNIPHFYSWISNKPYSPMKIK